MTAVAHLVEPALVEKAQTGGIWLVALSLLGLLIRQIGPWSKQRAADEQTFRESLLDRETGLLEREAALTERVERLEAAIKQQQTIHDAERALDRHRINNLTQCLDALLLLLQAAPEKAAEHVEKINDMRRRQQLAESEEKGLIHAAKSVVTEPAEAQP